MRLVQHPRIRALVRRDRNVVQQRHDHDKSREPGAPACQHGSDQHGDARAQGSRALEQHVLSNRESNRPIDDGRDRQNCGDPDDHHRGEDSPAIFRRAADARKPRRNQGFDTLESLPQGCRGKHHEQRREIPRGQRQRWQERIDVVIELRLTGRDDRKRQGRPDQDEGALEPSPAKRLQQQDRKARDDERFGTRSAEMRVHLQHVEIPRVYVRGIEKCREPGIDVFGQHGVPQQRAEDHLRVYEPGSNQHERHCRNCAPQAPVSEQDRARFREQQRGNPDYHREKRHGDEFRHEAEDEIESRRDAVTALPASHPLQIVKNAAAVGKEEGAFHVVRPQAVLEQQRAVNEQEENRDAAADRPGEQTTDGKDVEEGDTAEDRVPEPQAEFIVREQPGA